MLRERGYNAVCQSDSKARSTQWDRPGCTDYAPSQTESARRENDSAALTHVGALARLTQAVDRMLVTW